MERDTRVGSRAVDGNCNPEWGTGHWMEKDPSRGNRALNGAFVNWAFGNGVVLVSKLFGLISSTRIIEPCCIFLM